MRIQRLLGQTFSQRVARSFSVKAFDPYKVLGVQRSDDFPTIKKRYYKLVSQYHPDKNGAPVGLLLTFRKPTRSSRRS